MTLWDLFTGHWTWALLIGEFARLVPLIAAFYAGYWRGRVIEQRQWMTRLHLERMRVVEQRLK